MNHKAILMMLGAMLLAAAVPATGSAQSNPLAGKAFDRVEGWEYGGETISFAKDGSFAWSVITGDSSIEREGTCTTQAGQYGTELSFEFQWREEGDSLWKDGSHDTYYALEPGRGDVLVFYDAKEIRGVYVAQGGVFIYAPDFSASSELSETLKGKTITYSATYLGDHTLEKFWAEGARGTGAGSRISASLDLWDGGSLAECSPWMLIVWNGFPMNPEMFAANARAKALDVVAGGKIPTRVAVGDAFTPQFLRIPGTPGAGSVSITVAEATKGTKYEDLCIAEILILGKRVE
ncbi:MAG: hypothetical protein NT080_11800 [Spirochaetes bacterium]|nr:hypothetical protein [Spirochaetota bacterium]